MQPLKPLKPLGLKYPLKSSRSALQKQSAGLDAALADYPAETGRTGGKLGAMGDLGKSLLGGTTDTTTPSYKKGGKVKRTGPAKLHKGEKVIKAKAKKPAARRR